MTAERCEGVWRFCDAFVDGEFGEAERAEFEAHLEQCEACQKTVREQAAWKVAVRAAAPREKAPDLLRARLNAALERESKAMAEERLHSELGEAAALAAEPPRRSFATRAWPYAAAAMVACTLLFSQGRHAGVTADVIAKHQRNLPIEVTGRSDDLRRWYADKVDFPVRPPKFDATIGTQNVALRGGRLTNVRDHQAAYLVYDVGGDKVSVFIFDPSEMNLEARRRARVGNREVFLDDERGYNVAIYRDHGVGYAIASDLDQDQMLKLVSAAVEH